MNQDLREISQWLDKLPETFGVYKFFDKNKKLIYVGKAINLKKRVAQYFVKNPKSNKVATMAALIVYIDFIVTKNEPEALLLENNIIFNSKPVFNIKLKNNKIYPFIIIDNSLGFAKVYISWHAKGKNVIKFGPFVSKYAATELVEFIQSVLLLRSCLDKVFKNRSRPCILYEIGKCSAPCVSYTDNSNYQTRSQQAIDFLSGKTNSLRNFCVAEMQKNSELKNYELAAFYRDKIKQIELLNKPQAVIANSGDYAVYIAESLYNNICVHIILIKNGEVVDQQNVFVAAPLDQDLAACIFQIFVDNMLNCQTSPIHFIQDIIVSHKNEELLLIKDLLFNQFNKRYNITDQIPSAIKKIIELAILNAKTTLRLSSRHKLSSLYEEGSIKKALNLTAIPENIECFDISHFQGDCSVASCVLFNAQGAVKKAYRAYNINLDNPGDDYKAIYQAVYKRYKSHKLPDLILIDGGIGQLKMAELALNDLGLDCALLAVSKGKARVVGQEKLNFVTGKSIQLENTNKALHCIQAIRDEAHRYAIKNHRKKLQKKSLSSIITSIPGIGEKKKQLLLNHFIELKSLEQASEKELMLVSGISKKLAKVIYEFFH
jgi:excinuclease ABC subunit C